MDSSNLKIKYQRLCKKRLFILIAVLALWALACGLCIGLFVGRVIRIFTAVSLSGAVTAFMGVFCLAFCTLKLVPSYRTYRIFLEASGYGITTKVSFTIDSIDEEIVTKQAVDYYIVNALERKLLAIATEPVPAVGSKVNATLLGNTIVEWSELPN